MPTDLSASPNPSPSTEPAPAAPRGAAADPPPLRTEGLTATALPPRSRLPQIVQTVLFGSYRDRWMPRLRRRHGDVFRLRVFPERDVVQLANVEHIRAVFGGSAELFHAGEGNVVLKPAMGAHSVLLTDEDVHLRARKLLMPAFNGAALRGYRDLMADLAAAEVSGWRPGPAMRSHDRMQAVTLEIILRVVFGVSEGARLDRLRELLRSIVDVGPVDILGWHQPALQRVGVWKRGAEVRRAADELIYAEIADRRRADDLAERRDVLSRLLSVGDAESDGLSDSELRDQLITLLLAGHETTATALAWTLHELARDPRRLAEATRAADRAAPGAAPDDDSPGGSAADGEKYLEAVVKEAMRLHPVISEVARVVTSDVEIGGYRIPAGHTVMPSITMVQHDPAHHDDPDAFRPERFTEGGPATGTWFPFGGGVRRCLGAGFSLVEATAVLGEVLRRYHIAPDRSRRERAKARNITMVPARGARIVLTPR